MKNNDKFPHNVDQLNDIHDDDIDSAGLLEGPVAYNDLSRRDVRSLIFHLLYAMESFDYDESLSAIVDNLNRGFNRDIPLNAALVKTADAVIYLRHELDALYQPLLANWRFDRLGVCTKLILRFAVWELVYTDTDPRIIINEAVELAKSFAEQDAYRFVNGVLDRVVKARALTTSEPNDPA